MRRGGPAGSAAAVCLLAASMALALASVIGHAQTGLALAAGFVIGAVNAPLALRALTSEIGFRVTSIARLAVLTAGALTVGALLGWGLTAGLVVAAVGLAQLILATVAAREVLRA